MKRLMLMLAFVAVCVCSKAAILEDGKMWIIKFFNPNYPDPADIQYHFLKYRVGDEQIYNGRVWRWVKHVRADGQEFNVALMYEEDDVLYMCDDIYSNYKDLEDYWEYYTQFAVNGAFPIIDFNYQVGDTLRNGYTEVVSIDDAVIRGVSRKVVKLSAKYPNQTYWIKDIGSTNFCFATPPLYFTSDVYVLEGCYQGDTCLYKAGDLPDSDFGGIESIIADAYDSAPLYDLMGRCVEHPQRGSLYIRGGKKLIWQE